MRRRQFLQAGAAAVAGASALAAPAIAQTAPEIGWRLGSSSAKLLDTLYGTG